jgi:hypothetical protein
LGTKLVVFVVVGAMKRRIIYSCFARFLGVVEVLPDKVRAMFLSFFRALKPSKKAHKGIVMM